MIIPIDEGQRIVSNAYSWDLEVLITPKPGGKRKEPYWKPIKYYGTLSQALHKALEREIRLHPAEGIAECIKAAQSVSEKYLHIFEGVKL